MGLGFLVDEAVNLRNLPINRGLVAAIFLAYNPTLVAQHKSQFQELMHFLVTQSA
jgi:hypothetical protein